MNGKLIVIDGLDGSGKATQTKLLYDRLTAQSIPSRHITFPDYESTSSSLVKMYLQGKIHTDPDMVNAYAASSFYAADRYISYVKKWGPDYQNGTTILADRYVSSNLIHQMVKLPTSAWDEFMQWLYDYEFNKLQLPQPDIVLYLDMPLKTSQQLLSKRYKGDQTKKDIHESDLLYLEKCREAALYAAQALNWTKISCADEGTLQPYSIEDIAKQVYKNLDKFFENKGNI